MHAAALPQPGQGASLGPACEGIKWAGQIGPRRCVKATDGDPFLASRSVAKGRGAVLIHLAGCVLETRHRTEDACSVGKNVVTHGADAVIHAVSRIQRKYHGFRGASNRVLEEERELEAITMLAQSDWMRRFLQGAPGDNAAIVIPGNTQNRGGRIFCEDGARPGERQICSCHGSADCSECRQESEEERSRGCSRLEKFHSTAVCHFQ